MSLISPEKRKFPKCETFNYGDFRIETVKSHILTKDDEEKLDLKLPHLPDMLFLQNRVTFHHSKKGFSLSFDPVEALKFVNDHENQDQVSFSKEWRAARKDDSNITKVIHPYDWTYTPRDYKGKVEGKLKESLTTDLKINYEKLKSREPILFFDEVILYEDELDDNGASSLTVKLRVMSSGFFCLMRFYLRVDNTLIRVIDTRTYYESNNDYILQEYSERESKTSDIQVPVTMMRNPDEIVNHLSIKKELIYKLEFPST